MNIRQTLSILSLLSITFNVFAADIEVSEQYVRETIPGTKISSAYMLITNNSDKELILTAAKSNVSSRIELHQHIMTEDMMKMQQVDSIIIKANDNVKLQPHGYHIMIFDIDKPLVADTEITMALEFENHPPIKILMPVKGIKKKRHHH
ncbi:copper chaperone PCu(A)C [Thalassotalea crassostreae]|uniref:copper chaperone PCu(A)C n=1 Tax=Thalassotalea crassostreae TaxID=1763536 RepID=UPI00083918E3|nr:copper chaperone PCu(A)C [Thalassotalea crassostreae]